MKFETYYSTDEQKPLEIDDVSSQYVVRIRKDIERVERQEEDGTQFKGWKYKECVVDNPDWVASQLKENKESNEAIMMGLCDLFEQNLGS